MSEKFYCVVDARGYFKNYVYTRADESGQEVVQHYQLLEGERLLDTKRPTKRQHAGGAGFVRPRWDEDAAVWVEGASEEELAAWEAEHPAPMIDLDALRAAKQEQNKQALADWLAAHPLTWTDGNVYGTTKDDQDEMALNYMQYQLAISANQPAVLEWHTQKKRCHTFTLAEFTALALAIRTYVYPYRQYQEAVKEAIYMAETKEELDAIEIDYGSVGAAA